MHYYYCYFQRLCDQSSPEFDFTVTGFDKRVSSVSLFVILLVILLVIHLDDGIFRHFTINFFLDLAAHQESCTQTSTC